MIKRDEGEKEVMVCVGKLLIVVMKCVGVELVIMVLGEELVEMVLQELVVMISVEVEEVTMVLEVKLVVAEVHMVLVVVVMICVRVKEASLEAEPLLMPEAWEDLEATHGVILSA